MTTSNLKSAVKLTLDLCECPFRLSLIPKHLCNVSCVSLETYCQPCLPKVSLLNLDPSFNTHNLFYLQMPDHSAHSHRM